MSKYAAGEARAWALERLKGCCGCVSPTFTADLSALNERAIRHDVAYEKQLGMSAILLVSEGGTTEPEMQQFVEIAVDEAGSDLTTVLQASQPTLPAMRTSIQHAEQAGVDLVLPSYPLTFHPADLDEVFDLTTAVAATTHLGVIVFAMDNWNFSRLHPAGFPVSLLARMVDEIPNVVAIKNEVGGPGVGGIAEVFEQFTGTVVVTDPMESNAPAWVKNYGMSFLGTSNYECMGAEVPRYFGLLQHDATFAEGMERYWKVHPVRRTNAALVGAITSVTSLVPRVLWKYQGWLVGFNGGPLRQPLMRINSSQMSAMRNAAIAAHLDVCDDDDAAFWVGRNPK